MGEIKNCPRCNSSDCCTEILNEDFDDCYPLCNACGLQGPLKNNHKEAAEWWNTRTTDPPEDITGLAHELWALAQLIPEEGILDGVMRIEEALKGKVKGSTDPLLEKMDEAYKAACDFIESNVCDPDITQEMREKYQAFIEKKTALQKYRERLNAK